MLNKRPYRLGEYRITDYENGRLTWEGHIGFGVQQRGDGYILGDVLLLGLASQAENGFLIGEFLKHLKKMAVWKKTRYYCHTSEILETATGLGLGKDFLSKVSFLEKMTPRVLKPGMFRLGKYRIIVTADHKLAWQTSGGVNRVVGGPGRVESGLLILGPQEEEEEVPRKRDFLEQINQLPQWVQTRVWCRESVLRECREPQPAVRFKEQLKVRNAGIMRAAGKGLKAIPQNRSKETFRRFFTFTGQSLKSYLPRLHWPFRFNGRKPTGSWPLGKKSWLIGLILLVISGLVFGVAVTYHSLEKMWEGSHGHKKYHH